MTYDFTGLSQAQQALLTFEGWQKYRANMVPRPQRRTVQLLLDRGLIEHNGRPSMDLGYIVPRDVHIAWCEHCSQLASNPKASA